MFNIVTDISKGNTYCVIKSRFNAFSICTLLEEGNTNQNFCVNHSNPYSFFSLTKALILKDGWSSWSLNTWLIYFS